MKNQETSRLLRVLIIDDRLQGLLKHGQNIYTTHLEITPIQSWGDAQKVIAKDGDIGGADLLLVDVSLDEDQLIQKAASAAGKTSLLPVGPLLALPFIGRRAIMSCVIYSGHITNPQLHSHPFFLLAMGLIAAKANGLPNLNEPYRSKWLDRDSKVGTLDKEITNMGLAGVGNVVAALEQAIEDYRERLETLIKDEDVIVGNCAVLEKRLAELIKQAEQKQPVKIDNELTLMLSGPSWADHINLRSLFADTLGFSEKEVCLEWLKDRRDWLLNLPGSNIGRALGIYRLQEDLSKPKNGSWVTPEVVDLVAQQYGKKLNQAELTELLRYVILFANAYANIIENSSTRETVLRRLGDKMDQRRYSDLFGARTKKEGGKRRGPFDSIRPLALGKTGLESYFLQEGSSINPEDRDAIAAFLRAEGCDKSVEATYKIKTAGK